MKKIIPSNRKACEDPRCGCPPCRRQKGSSHIYYELRGMVPSRETGLDEKPDFDTVDTFLQTIVVPDPNYGTNKTQFELYVYAPFHTDMKNKKVLLDLIRRFGNDTINDIANERISKGVF